MTDQPSLRQRVARAIHRYDNHHALSGNDIPSKHHYGEADFVLAELRAELAASVVVPAADRAADADPVRCPLCPDARILDTPADARDHFATVHPEQRLVGSGPWPLLANREQPADRAALRDRIAEERLARVLHWVTSDVVTAKTEFGNGYRAAQRDIRDLIRGRFDADAANELRRVAAETPPAETAAVRLSEELCPGFPDRCPNLRTVEPEQGVHLGGVRCGCADDPAPAVEAQPGKDTETP